MTAASEVAGAVDELRSALANDDAFEAWYGQTVSMVYSYLGFALAIPEKVAVARPTGVGRHTNGHRVSGSTPRLCYQVATASL